MSRRAAVSKAALAKQAEADDDAGTVADGAGGSAASMGLKVFSRHVWLKVMEKKTCDYNQVRAVQARGHSVAALGLPACGTSW